jgi:predicted DCC family thiol-disulfide oxidoreductase YuxK
VILFTKQNCSNCDYVKALLANSSPGGSLRLASLDTDEGLALLALYEGVSVAQKEVPVLIDQEEDLSELMVQREVITGLDSIIERLLAEGHVALKAVVHAAKSSGQECEGDTCKL